jgi:tetratricopeptide (TPR) repeat protein
LWSLGYKAYTKNDRIGARDYYERALRADPNYAPALNSLGRLEGDDKKSDERSWYERALKAKPNYAPAMNNLAIVEFESGQLDHAEQLAKQANSIRPGISTALLGNIAVARQLKLYTPTVSSAAAGPPPAAAQ